MTPIKCSCGARTMTFKHLSAEDLPNGWKCDECDKQQCPKIEEKTETKENTIELEVPAIETASNASWTETVEEVMSEMAPETIEQTEISENLNDQKTEKPKRRRGRRRKKQND